MDFDSLTTAQRRLYHATVAQTHHREVELQVLTLNGVAVTSLTNAFMGGSIQGDSTRTPCEVLEADVLDEDFALAWSNGEHRKYKVRVVDSRFIPELNDWVGQVVFTGPLWDFEREGPVVSLVAHGSELLALGSVRRVMTRPRKTRATAVIRDLLSAAGAAPANMSIPNLAAKLPERVTVGIRRGKKRKGKKDKRKPPKVQVFRATPEDTYWTEAEQIAEAINRDLYCDGRGRFLLRAEAKRAAVTFSPSTILAPVSERRPTEGEVTNKWVVVGADPKGPKKRVQVEVSLPARHPLSAESLKWHNAPREIIERIENKQLRTKAQARAVGVKHRDRAMRELVEYEVDALPIVGWLRPDSLVSVPVNGGAALVRVKQWTLPLGPGADPLTIGANRRRGRGGGGGPKRRHDSVWSAR